VDSSFYVTGLRPIEALASKDLIEPNIELSSTADHSPVVAVMIHQNAAVVAGIPGDCSNDLLGGLLSICPPI